MQPAGTFPSESSDRVYPPVPHPLLFLISTSLKVELNMKNRTETLEIGSRAPDFSLGAANREGTFTLGGSARTGYADSRVSARHLVTELREAHDSVRVAETGN